MFPVSSGRTEEEGILSGNSFQIDRSKENKTDHITSLLYARIN